MRATSSSAGSDASVLEQRAVLVVHHYLELSEIEAAASSDIRANRQVTPQPATIALRAAIEADDRTPDLATEVPA